MHGFHESKVSITSLVELHVDSEDAFEKPDAVAAAPFGLKIFNGFEFVFHGLCALADRNRPYSA